MFAHKSQKFAPINPEFMIHNSERDAEHFQSVENLPRSPKSISDSQITDSYSETPMKTCEKMFGDIYEMSYKEAVAIVLDEWEENPFTWQNPSKKEGLFDNNEHIASMFEPLSYEEPYPLDTPCVNDDEVYDWYNQY